MISEAGVLEAVRAGRTVAYDGHGRLTRDPEQVRTVVLFAKESKAGRSSLRPAFGDRGSRFANLPD
jgi:hypothetical protein